MDSGRIAIIAMVSIVAIVALVSLQANSKIDAAQPHVIVTDDRLYSPEASEVQEYVSVGAAYTNYVPPLAVR
ncbi:hypothetical protein KY327_00055 [Candidatus Woesearchaeota archaeon]|nr:hypothetical protein [Candidatus Woesearchaeota archaeon]